jgi:hypothetical protein
VAVLDFMVPGFPELIQANVESLREHQIARWSKHGGTVRSDVSVTHAVDGLTADEIKHVAAVFGVASPWT